MFVPQLSVFLENKPGRLESLLNILAKNEINIITITIAEVNDFGIIRMIVDKPDLAAVSLKESNFTCSVNNVLAVEIDDQPGALSHLLECLANVNMNIEYMYAFNEKRNDKAVMLFRFENIEKAKETLLDAGYTVITRKDLIGE